MSLVDMSEAQILAARKLAGPALRKAGLPNNLVDFEPWRMEWRALNDCRAALRKVAGDLVEKMYDGMDEARARETEAGYDAILAAHDDVEEEINYRGKIRNKAPRDQRAGDPRRPLYPVGAVRGDGGGPVEVEPEGRAVALRPEERMADAFGGHDSGLPSLGVYFRSMVLGGRTDAERRALTEGSDSGGGYTVPTTLAAQLIDRLRAQSVVIRAGARTVPLDSDTHSWAVVANDPVPGWRAEAGSVTEDDPTFRSVTFEPKSLAVLVKASRELLDDSLNIQAELPRIIAAAMAAEVDRAVLFGSGSGSEPLGLVNDSGIQEIALAGALESYAPLIQARTRVLTSNAEPSAFILHPREEGVLAGLTATDGQPLMVPRALEAIPMLTSTTVPVDGGAGNNEASILTGDFQHLLLGIRQDLRIEVLRERYANTLEYGFLAHLRVDTARVHSAAFCKVTGITPESAS